MNSTKMLGECTFELGSERDINGDARVAYVIIDCNLLSVVCSPLSSLQCCLNSIDRCRKHNVMGCALI